MTKVILNNKSVDFDAAVNLMDDEIREDLHKDAAGAIAYKYADPTESARWIYEETDMEDIRAQDPSLIKDVNQAFVDLYATRHAEKFGEDFRVE